MRLSNMCTAVLCSLALAACAGNAPVPAPPAGGNDIATGELSSDADAEAEVSDTVSADGSTADGADVQFVCNPAEPAEWTMHQYKVFSSAVGHLEPSPPPYDDQCKAKFDRACTTICDCKFISVQCHVMAASVNAPWTKWPIVGPPGTDGKCTNLTCTVSRGPESCLAQLACVNGKCIASGNCTYAEQPDWP